MSVGQMPGIGESSAAGGQQRVIGRNRKAVGVEHRQFTRANLLFGCVEISTGKQFSGRNLAGHFG